MDPNFPDMKIPICSKDESNFEHEIASAEGTVCVLGLQKTLNVDGNGMVFEKIVEMKTMGDRKLESTTLKADQKMFKIRTNMGKDEEKAFNDEGANSGNQKPSSKSFKF